MKLCIATGVVEKDDGGLRDEIAGERHGGKAGTSRAKRGTVHEHELSAAATEGSGAFWRSFLRWLLKRGLRGVQLVVFDAHAA